MGLGLKYSVGIGLKMASLRHLLWHWLNPSSTIRSRKPWKISSSSGGVMAKNRNKKKKNGVAPMDTAEPTLLNIPQAMDTSESVATTAARFPASGDPIKRKKGVPMKRSKNARKMKAIAKALAQSEKSMEKITKNQSRTLRVNSAKTLYE